MVSCVTCYMHTIFEGLDCIQARITRAKRNKCKELVSLQNINHRETYIADIDAKKMDVMSKFCDRVFEPYNFYVTILYHKRFLQVIIK